VNAVGRLSGRRSGGATSNALFVTEPELPANQATAHSLRTQAWAANLAVGQQR